MLKAILTGLIVLLFACSRNNNQVVLNPFQPKSVAVRGYLIPKDSLEEAKAFLAGDPRRVIVGKTDKFPENNIIFQYRESKNIRKIEPVIYIMGKNGTKYSASSQVTEKPFLCKAPEIVLVKEPYSKDNNPENFISFSKLQGLRHDQVRSLIQDKTGNIWLGTDDGLTKYDGKYFSHYTTDQGLNNNLILSVFQDKKDNIWIGTFGGGVTRYDGRFLTLFTSAEGFLNDVVNCIFEDNDSNMWFGTGGGIVKYDGKYFTNFTRNQGLCNNDVRSILQDNSGKIWISTYGGGISVFDGKSFSNISENEGLAENYINILFKDKTGDIWIGFDNKGVMKYNGSEFIPYSKLEGLSNNSIETILQDDFGNIWFGSSEGISKFDGKYFTSYTEKEGLCTYIVVSSLKDKKGNLWFGTKGGGIIRYYGNLFTNLSTNELLSKSRVMCILEDNSKNFWFGTFGGYVIKLSYQTVNGIKRKYFTLFGEKEGLLNSRIYSIIKDRDGNIWFGSDGGGVSRFDGKTMTTYTEKEGLCNNSVRKIIQDRNGNFWFATYGAGISKFDGIHFTNYSKKEGLSSNNVLTILQDKRGNLWFGTDGGGITCFDGKNFIHFTKKQGFFNNTVYSILEDKDGILWFGTGGDGVIRYDGKSFTRFSDDEGLTNNYILSLLQDSHNNIWFGTRFGPNILKKNELDKIQKKNGIPLFKSYSYRDGFLGIGCSLGGIYEDKEGTIWIGTNNRLTVFHSGGEKSNTLKPSIQITNIQLFNEDIPWVDLVEKKDTTILLQNGVNVGKFKFDGISKWYGLPENLSLSYKNNYISFNYVCIEQDQIEKIKYQYKLDGLDNNWDALTSKTEASYVNLHPGKYVFRVKAMNSEGYFSDEIDYQFIIRPPWWQTLWFYMTFSVTVIVLIISYFRYRVKKLKHDKDLLQIIVQKQTHELTEKNEELIKQKKEILENITAIEKNNLELQTANKEKDKFFSIIAHDLRGPFNSFMGLTQIMSEELHTLTMSEIHEISVSMRDSATNLFRLLENLLQWSRIKQGILPFNQELLSLHSVFNEGVAIMTEQSRIKDIEITYSIPDDIIVFADSNMLQTIIRNLISNSVKFTPKGGKILVTAKPIDDKYIEISILDTGIGMDPSMVNCLFQIGTQSNRTGTEGEPSTGLGLILCKEFIEKHGGKIRIESEVGYGSAFSFTIPGNRQQTTDLSMKP